MKGMVSEEQEAAQLRRLVSEEQEAAPVKGFFLFIWKE